MPGKKRLRVSNNQLRLIDIEPSPPKKQKKPKVTKRVDSLEKRVTHLEAEVALTRGQLEREEDLDEEDD